MLFPETLTSSELKRWETKAMASAITIQAPDRSPEMDAAVRKALALFRTVEAACTRFDPTSALMRANARPSRWHRLPRTLFDSLAEGYEAFRATEGVFDPRVHDTLVGLGYYRSFSQGVGTLAGPTGPVGTDQPWRFRAFRPLRLAHLGGQRVDLGGIGKGLAVRWAAEAIRMASGHFLIEAGGDCYAAGCPSPASAWRIGVECPSGDGGPVAVIEGRDVAVATSSIRVRRWRRGDQSLHHIIDPGTGRPGGGRLLSVTVVHPDPAQAEVWSKTAFLAGDDRIARFVDEHGLPALWVDDSGAIGTSAAMKPYLLWERA